MPDTAGAVARLYAVQQPQLLVMMTRRDVAGVDLSLETDFLDGVTYIMQNKKALPKFIFMVLILVVTFLLFVVPVSANGPVPGPSIIITINGDNGEMSNSIIFIDLLVPIAVDSDDYTDYNSENGNQLGISETSKIVRYNEGGFISYTFHYQGASPGTAIQEPEHDPSYAVQFETGLVDLKGKVEHMKVAFLDREGDILHVTESIQIADTMIGFFVGGVKINLDTLKVTDDGYYVSGWNLFTVLIRMFPRMAFSVILEALIAYFFRFKPLGGIVLINILTQLVLTIIMLATRMPYWQSLVIGEIAVYLIEAVVMLLTHITYKKGRIITFVVVANTVTLSLGILMNSIGVFKY